ncbi:hypothetical protein NEUTE1DRAFT_108309 [Neurospora tetrasperma FGSC 2508]|uniref:Uncharacterized protein n=1 Tax=Neurospora tetrasperma (strain FGSC 2508 / ATCC MYA-4615 / P0657) TaxID=510951 RepID=F8MGZ3_NEUT8|nr:uncharacterized protein NEUTE1DRAFT_108309 [Neurospora tetrasperma FGSC 2508]EGO58712.1 hypothetical protein NEUTE1DRAFT_108309 [Neurospora tetrasperma FGSC 2508]EGZ72800.1 hypothetical protein NEUTE2DRAFT_137239 [Neurospora tetrasperma FGSC 2509]
MPYSRVLSVERSWHGSVSSQFVNNMQMRDHHFSRNPWNCQHAKRLGWNFIDDCPEYWTELETGKLRLEVKPGPEHEWHDEWRDRLMKGEGCYGPQGPPPYPPFKVHPPWEGKTMTREHRNAYYFEEDSPRKLWLEQRAKLKKQKKSQKKQEQTSEAGPSHQHSTRAQGSRVPSITPSQPTESSNPRTQSSKRDKGKGRAVDPPAATTESTTAPVAGPSSASVPARNSASASASTSTVAGPSIANPITATVSKEEGIQETVAKNAEDKSSTNVQRRATKIKIIPPGSKQDVKGKGKAVDKPSHVNNNAHKITKPSGSKEPAAVATNRIIKRSQVVKGKYWASKLDSSMFTKDGSIKAAFSDDKDNSGSKAKEKGNGMVSDGANDNGEGSSSMASSSKTATAINIGNDDNSDDELALGQDSDDYDSGSETDDSKDSTYTLTDKAKKGKVTTAAAAATITASSSDSSSNKRKRATTDTGDDEKTAYYVLRCPLDLDCMSQSDSTHNDPEDIKGVFCRHPFKRRRAMNHIETCQLDEELRSEKQIWENCCLRVVPDRKNTPVNDEWAMRHNRTLIRSLVHKAGGGKRAREKMEKELEEDL